MEMTTMGRILVYQEGGFVFALKKDELKEDLPKSLVNHSE